MGLVTRGRSFGPAAPKGADGKVSEENSAVKASPSPPLPTSPIPLVRVTSPDEDGPLAVSSPTSFLTSAEGQRDLTSDRDGFDTQSRQRERVAVSGDTGNLGDDQDGAYHSEFDDDDLDTQEQRDINSLIQK